MHTDHSGSVMTNDRDLRSRIKVVPVMISLCACSALATCRDVVAWTRRDVVAALGGWAAACPALFMADVRLKYLAWGMSDKARPLVLPAFSMWLCSAFTS